MYTKQRVSAFILAAALFLGGCIRVVNEIKTPDGGEQGDTAATDAGVSSAQGGAGDGVLSDDEMDAAAGARTTSPDLSGETPAYVLTISEESWDDIDTLIANRLFAVCRDGLWGVIDETGKEVFPIEYDSYATDGESFFSLSQKSDDGYDARLYHVSDGSGEPREIFANDAYPGLNITVVNSPYMTLASDDPNALHRTFLEWEQAGDSDFDFYLLSSFNREDAILNGFDADAWEDVSDFFLTMTSDGGAFISCNEWYEEEGFCFNVVGIDGLNQIVLSVEERNKTVQMLPYVPNDEGWYACYVIDSGKDAKRLAFGNVKTAEYSTYAMKLFPEEAAEVVADLSAFHKRAGRTDRIVLRDGDGNAAVYNMKTAKPETEFVFRDVLLPESTDYPVLVDDGAHMGYIAYGESDMTGNYAAATLYDESFGIALVRDEDGALYAVDNQGRRVSEKEEGFENTSLRYLHGAESHAFSIILDDGVRLCTAEEPEL